MSLFKSTMRKPFLPSFLPAAIRPSTHLFIPSCLQVGRLFQSEYVSLFDFGNILGVIYVKVLLSLPLCSSLGTLLSI